MLRGLQGLINRNYILSTAIGVVVGISVVVTWSAFRDPTNQLECISHYSRGQQSQYIDRKIDALCADEFSQGTLESRISNEALKVEVERRGFVMAPRTFDPMQPWERYQVRQTRLQFLRKTYPEYNDLSDSFLISRIYKKYFSDKMSLGEFNVYMNEQADSQWAQSVKGFVDSGVKN